MVLALNAPPTLHTDPAPRGRWLPPWRVDGTVLPPHQFAVAKGLVLLLWFFGEMSKFDAPFVAILPPLEWLPGGPTVWALRATIAAGSVLVLGGRAPRLGCGLISASLGVGITMNALVYRNSIFFVAAVLLLMATHVGPISTWLLRLQFSVMYAGAALNKLLIGDWRDGTYFEHWQTVVLDNDWWSRLDASVPGPALAVVAGWTVITTEFALAVALMHRRTVWPALGVAVVFHTVPVITDGLTFGIFYSALALAFFVFLEPEESVGRGRLLRFAHDPHLPWALTVGYVAAALTKDLLVAIL